MFGRHPKEFVGVRRSCCVFEQHSCVTAFREPAPRSFYESACNPTVVLVAALSVPALGKFERSPFADPSLDASLIDGFDSDEQRAVRAGHRLAIGYNFTISVCKMDGARLAFKAPF